MQTLSFVNFCLKDDKSSQPPDLEDEFDTDVQSNGKQTYIRSIVLLF